MKESMIYCQIKRYNKKGDGKYMTDYKTIKQEMNNMEVATDKVMGIDIDQIRPNPFQPRRIIAEEKVEELAKSIQASGLIQPIVVRRARDGYQLVVGERRYLACRKLGWKKISAAVKAIPDREMASIALIENLQRENLSLFEEANGYQNLMKNFGLTQETLSKKMGKSQSTIANKLRLLKLPKVVRDKIVKHNLTERHARALLRLESEDEQLLMIEEICMKGLNVNQTEKRIEKINEERTNKKRANNKKTVVRDMRIFLNTIRDAVSMIEDSGLYPEVEEKIENDFIEITIRLSKEMIKK